MTTYRGPKAVSPATVKGEVAIKGIREVLALITLGFGDAVPQGFRRDVIRLQHPRQFILS